MDQLAEDHRSAARGLADLRRQFRRRSASVQSDPAVRLPRKSYDMFLQGSDPELSEIESFDAWIEEVAAAGLYTFEMPRESAQAPNNVLVCDSGERLPVINMASYNYLGLGYHPAVIAAAKEALDRYGLGVSSSPITGGTIGLHRELERGLVDFLGIPGRGASLFTTGYNVNTGTVSSIIKAGGHVVLDSAAHMSLMEGAQMSGGQVHVFRHNDCAHLERVLRDITREGPRRILVCTEGVFSADGDLGDIAGVVAVSKRHGAMVLVDEAHSILVCGPGGRGVAAAAGVLDQVDFLVMTFSKAFGAIGGAVVARREITRYINWYARNRLFSCGLDPAVTGGVVRALEVGKGPEGEERRHRVAQRSRQLRKRLRGHVHLVESDSHIVPVIYGSDHCTPMLLHWLQRAGLETSVVQFPAAPQQLSRLRLFVTSEHGPDLIDRAADIVLEAAQRFDFAVDASPAAA